MCILAYWKTLNILADQCVDFKGSRQGMNDQELGDIFSDLFDFVSLSKCLVAPEKMALKLSQFSKILKMGEDSSSSTLYKKELNKIMELLPNFGFFKNIFSEYLWCTPMYAHKMGFDSPEDLIGKSDLYFPWSFEMATCYQEADELVLLTAESTHRKEEWIFEYELENENRDKNIIVSMHRYPVFDRQGHVIGVFGVGKEDVVATQLSKMSFSLGQKEAPSSKRSSKKVKRTLVN
jgi:hypothetical protein